ncbi:MAG TPA: hypothetical protein GX709_05275 [Clostridiales bacterium]|nr:hypothetical protein [Clostridiales bacterium]
MSKKISIIDVSSGQIRLALIDTKYSNAYLYHKALPYEGYQDGEFFDVQELFSKISSLIKECEETTFISLDEILIGVPGEFTSVVCQHVDYDLGVRRKVNDKDVAFLFETGRDSLNEENQIAISTAPIYYLLDDKEKVINPIGKNVNKLSGLISYVLCEKSFIKLFDSIAQSNGVKFNYTSSILAEVMFLIPENVRDQGVIFVDYGYISTTVNYVQGDGIVYSISFSLGSGNIAADLTIVNEIPFEHSLELLKKVNLNIKPITEDEYVIFIKKDNYAYNMRIVNEIVLARLEDIAAIMEKAINMCPSNIPQSVPVIITGAGLGTMIGIKEVFSKILNRQISFVAPSIPQLNKYSDSSLAALILLIDKGYQKPSFSFKKLINKIKNKFRQKSR